MATKLVTGSQLKQLGANIWNSGKNLVSKLYNDYTGNTQIDKSIAAQKEENQKAYAANLAQWNRENAYNHPAAQKSRLVSAGINADMMYGNGSLSNVAASSPQYGAADMSALAGKVSPLQAAGTLLGNKLVKAQIDKLKSDTKGVDIENSFKEQEKILGVRLSKQMYEKNKTELSILSEALEQAKIDTQTKGVDYALKQVDYAYRAQTFQTQLDILAQELNLKKGQVEEMITSRIYRLLDIEMSAKLKEADLKWNDPEILDKLGGSASATMLKILTMIFK